MKTRANTYKYLTDYGQNNICRSNKELPSRLTIYYLAESDTNTTTTNSIRKLLKV